MMEQAENGKDTKKLAANPDGTQNDTQEEFIGGNIYFNKLFKIRNVSNI
jgi:hypothetical protein